MSTVTHVGSMKVDNHFPDCDALTVSQDEDGRSITVSRMEDGSVRIHIQDDFASEARVYILGKGDEARFDPHAE